MKTMTEKMSSALNTQNLVQVNEVMQNFEKLFDNVDVNAEFMDKVMDNIDAGTYEEKDVNALINTVAAEHNMELSDEFGDISVKNKVNKQKVDDDFVLPSKIHN
jgi:division protein CdvB (Snf7/Vps24/ESCRT-III family)